MAEAQGDRAAMSKKTLLIKSVFLILFFVVKPLSGAQLSLDEIIISMEKLSEDTQQYSGLVDAAFKALLNENLSELEQQTQTINEKTESITRRSNAIVKHIEFYQNQILSEEDQAKMQRISALLANTEQNFNPAHERLGMLTKLTFKKNVNDILKALSEELDKSYAQKKNYPHYLDPALNSLGRQPYTLLYQWIDPQHFKVVIEPLPQAVAQGMVLGQKYVLTEDKHIKVLSLSDEVIETIDLTQHSGI